MSKFLYNPMAYATFRPQYPAALIHFLKELSTAKNLVLDCGTGSGQAARDLSQYFTQVIATDLSYELLSKAPQAPRITYVQARAEKLPIKSQTVDLICVAQALHWFSLPEFYAEVSRLLNPHGIIAAWCYNQCIIDAKVDGVINKIYSRITCTENISKEKQYVYDLYQTIPFPFQRIKSPNFEMEIEWDLNALLGYIATWPGLLDYQYKFKINLLHELKEEFIFAWGHPETKRTIKWPIYLLIGQLV